MSSADKHTATRFDLDERQRAMLEVMGVRVWSDATPPVEALARPSESVVAEAPRITPPAAPRQQPAPPSASFSESATSPMGWAELQQAVFGCTACGLCKHRKQTVFGVGSPAASEGQVPRVDWLVVGEAPGEQEDLAGEPFVGQAGKLLDNMLAAVGLSRHDSRGGGVYIINTLKCRPPANRNPQPQELAQCAPFLHRQIELLQPKVILAAGRFAAQSLLAHVADIEKIPLGKLRGQVHRLGQIPVVVTYHPAYLLRSLPDKAKAWEDLVLAARFV